MNYETCKYLFRASAVILAALLSGAVAAQNPPCTDGVFGGEVGDDYAAMLVADADNTDGGFFDSLSPEKKQIVMDCAGQTGLDSSRYELRSEVTVAGNVIGRVFEKLDEATGTYYLAVVLSGCYVDNVFAGSHVYEGYADSVGWPSQGNHSGHDYKDLRQSDKLVANLSCSGDPGFDLQPIEIDLIGRPGFPDGRNSSSRDPDVIWAENILGGTVGTLPLGFRAASSTVWNMTFSNWDVNFTEESGGGCQSGTCSEKDWASPGADNGPLCDDDGNCSNGYGSTWFDDVNLWEWQVVYELSWDASGCDALDPSAWQIDFNEQTHASPSKSEFELCAQTRGDLTVMKEVDPQNPWNKFEFAVNGPGGGFAIDLQDPGSNECVGGFTLQDGTLVPDCDNSDAWTYPDRRTVGLESTDGFLPGGGYTITEEVDPDLDYERLWECKTVDPACADLLTGNLADPNSNTLEWDSCPAVLSVCDVDNQFGGNDGDGDPLVLSGLGLSTGDFPLCSNGHVVCRFSNIGGECVDSANVIGDLQVLGGTFDQVTFSAAAVPVTQADGPEVIALSSFVPVADSSRWPGGIDFFVQPLPVKAEGDNLVPDKGEVCSGSDDTACLAWDSRTQLLLQAPTAVEVDVDRQIGLLAGERRVTYTVALNPGNPAPEGGQEFFEVPRQIEPFDFVEAGDPADPSNALELDLWQGFGLNLNPVTQARADSELIVKKTLEIRDVTIQINGSDTVVPFVAGDSFHADPVMLGGPETFFYLANDLGGDGTACDSVGLTNRGYRCFFEKQQRRRKVLFSSSNDGQVHAFDAGFFNHEIVDGQLQGEFDFGTGHEIFAHVPRPMLSHTKGLALDGAEHSEGIDGQLAVADIFIDPKHSTIDPLDEDDREWRSVVMGSYRDGGRGYFLLDVTNPDPLELKNVIDPITGASTAEFVPIAGSDYVTGCSSFVSGSLPLGCGTLSYPSVLWEFQDLCAYNVPCDDDNNGNDDLGGSWSKVNTGRILVEENGETVVKFAAIFGGGFERGLEGKVGNFLYIVDMETGRAIYKRVLVGSAAAEPAAVDLDQNGLIDTIYQATTAGLVYKVDIGTPGVMNSGVVDDLDQWTPFEIFETSSPGVLGKERPIFFAPTVLFVSQLGRYALAFGTGDRADLYSEAGQDVDGRFYMLLDTGFVKDTAPVLGAPLTESDLEFVSKDALAAAGSNFILAPDAGNHPGFALELGLNERAVTEVLSLSGLIVFTTYDGEDLVCDFQGSGSIYAILATNADPILGAAAEDRGESTAEGLAGRPVVSPRGIVRTDSGPGEGEQAGSDLFDAAEIQEIRQSLQGLFPANCRFGNYSLNVGTSLSNRGQVPIAQVPVCIVPKNWKEFF